MKIGYARVSTSEQDFGLAAQEAELTVAGCERIYADRVSGTVASRPELDRMLDSLREGDQVVIVRLDRLARSLPHLLELAAQFEAQGVDLTSLHESLDTSTPTGRFTYSVLGAVAQLERDLISARTKAGLAAAKEQGRTGGRPPALTDAQEQHAKELRAAGKPVAEIADLLGTSRQTIYRATA